MSDRTRFLFLMAIMVGVACLIGGIAVYFLYQTALEQEAVQLRENVMGQARFMESVAKVDAQQSQELSRLADQDFGPITRSCRDNPRRASLDQIRHAQSQYQGIDAGSERLLAQRVNDTIVFLWSHRGQTFDQPAPIPWDSNLAEPMRRALSGQSGSMIGVDDHGRKMLAAYEPVALLHLGLVATIDIAVFQRPFRQAGGMVIGFGLVTLGLGAAIFSWTGGPLLARIIQSERRFSTLVENLDVGIYRNTGGPHGRFLEANPAIARMFGYDSVEAFRAVAVTDLYQSPEERRMFVAMMKRDGECHGQVLRLKKRDGAPILAAVTAKVSFAEDGSIRWIDGMIEDITAQREAEAALRLAKQELELQVGCVNRIQNLFIEATPSTTLFGELLDELLKATRSAYGFIASVENDGDGQPFLQNLAITNIAWDEATRRHYDEHAPSGLRFPIKQALYAAPYTTREVVIANDPANDPRRGGLPPGHPPLEAFLGIPLWREEKIIGVLGLANRPGGYDAGLVSLLEPVLSATVRILESHRLLGQIRLSQEILANMAEGVALIRSRDGTIVHANPKFEALFGYAPGALTDRNIAVINSDGQREGEVLNRRRDGSTLWCQVKVTTFRHHQHGDVWLTIQQDITERKKAETLRQKNEMRLRKLLDLDRQLPNLDEAGLCRQALEIAVAVTDSGIGYLHLLNEDQDTIRLMAWNDTALEQCRAVYHGHYPLAKAGIWADSARLRRTVVHNDYPNERNRKGIPDGHFPVSRHMGTPVMMGDRVHLILGVGNKETPYDDNDILQLQMAAKEVQMFLTRWQDQETIRAALAQAEAASRAKGDFLAVMSHEIRTPMNIVIGMGELLLETRLDEMQRGYVIKLQQAGGNLLELINQILDLSKIEAGRMRIVDEPIPITGLIDEVVGLLEVIARDKGVALRAGVDGAVPPWILGDRLRLKQVLFNLMGNAIKFTEHGHVHVSATVAPGRPTMLRVMVQDTGIGIAAEEIDAIFGAFTQADASITRRYGGTGLGLALCRSLVELMGGRIQVESKVGEGSAFQVILPLKEALPPVTMDDDKITECANRDIASPLRILLAEDVEENQFLMSAYLRATPYRLTFVNNGGEAVAKVRSEPFDLVFMDVQMPIMDGYTATRAIRQWERETSRHPLPIVALTCNALEGEAERSRHAGCDLYLSKPVKKQQLMEVIQQIVSPRGGLRM